MAQVVFSNNKIVVPEARSFGAFGTEVLKINQENTQANLEEAKANGLGENMYLNQITEVDIKDYNKNATELSKQMPDTKVAAGLFMPKTLEAEVVFNNDTKMVLVANTANNKGGLSPTLMKAFIGNKNANESYDLKEVQAVKTNALQLNGGIQKLFRTIGSSFRSEDGSIRQDRQDAFTAMCEFGNDLKAQSTQNPNNPILRRGEDNRSVIIVNGGNLKDVVKPLEKFYNSLDGIVNKFGNGVVTTDLDETLDNLKKQGKSEADIDGMRNSIIEAVEVQKALKDTESYGVRETLKAYNENPQLTTASVFLRDLFNKEEKLIQELNPKGVFNSITDFRATLVAESKGMPNLVIEHRATPEATSANTIQHYELAKNDFLEGKNKEFGDALKAHLKGELSKTDASQLFKEIGNTYDKDGLSKAYRAVRDVRLELGKMLSGYVQAKADDNKKALDEIDKRAKQLVAPLAEMGVGKGQSYVIGDNMNFFNASKLAGNILTQYAYYIEAHNKKENTQLTSGGTSIAHNSRSNPLRFSKLDDLTSPAIFSMEKRIDLKGIDMGNAIGALPSYRILDAVMTNKEGRIVNVLTASSQKAGVTDMIKSIMSAVNTADVNGNTKKPNGETIDISNAVKSRVDYLLRLWEGDETNKPARDYKQYQKVAPLIDAFVAGLKKTKDNPAELKAFIEEIKTNDTISAGRKKLDSTPLQVFAQDSNLYEPRKIFEMLPLFDLYSKSARRETPFLTQEEKKGLKKEQASALNSALGKALDMATALNQLKERDRAEIENQRNSGVEYPESIFPYTAGLNGVRSPIGITIKDDNKQAYVASLENSPALVMTEEIKNAIGVELEYTNRDGNKATAVYTPLDKLAGLALASKEDGISQILANDIKASREERGKKLESAIASNNLHSVDDIFQSISEIEQRNKEPKQETIDFGLNEVAQQEAENPNTYASENMSSAFEYDENLYTNNFDEEEPVMPDTSYGDEIADETVVERKTEDDPEEEDRPHIKA